MPSVTAHGMRADPLEGDGARDARAPLDARRREWRLRSRGGRLTRSRIERDHDAELRETGGGSGGAAATGAAECPDGPSLMPAPLGIANRPN